MYLAIMIFSTAVKFLRNRKLAGVLLVVIEGIDKVALFDCVTMRFLFTDVAFNESASNIASCLRLDLFTKAWYNVLVL